MRSRPFAVLALMLSLLFAAGPVLAETLTFRVQSKHPNVVDVEFYSRTRSAVWPGDKKVYSIKDDEKHSYKLSCSPGERICYGAWVRGGGAGGHAGVPELLLPLRRGGRRGCAQSVGFAGSGGKRRRMTSIRAIEGRAENIATV